MSCVSSEDDNYDYAAFNQDPNEVVNESFDLHYKEEVCILGQVAKPVCSQSTGSSQQIQFPR